MYSNKITYSQFNSGNYIKDDLFLRYYFSLEKVRLPEKIKFLPFENKPQILQCDLTPLKNVTADSTRILSPNFAGFLYSQ